LVEIHLLKLIPNRGHHFLHQSHSKTDFHLREVP
jgi:hypothetical protein